MKKLSRNSAGFGAIEILVVVVVVGLIGFVGYYAYNQRNKNNSQTANTETTLQQQTQQPTASQEQPKKDPYEGWKAYDDTNLSLRYPKDWTSYKENDQPEWVFFKSSDYVPATELGPSVKAGQWLEVRVAKSESYDSYENDLKNAPTAQENHGGTYETIKIDGHNAILSDTKTHGTYWYATTYNNGKTYYFRFNVLDEDKPEVKELFKSILATVKVT